MYELTDNQYWSFTRLLQEQLKDISLYGSSPISQALNPRLAVASEAAYENTNKDVMQEKCLKAFALYWLIRQYHPEYWHTTAANELPRALSMTEFSGAYGIGDDLDNPDEVLLPYIEEYLSM
jgi:hypothetical protein